MLAARVLQFPTILAKGKPPCSKRLRSGDGCMALRLPCRLRAVECIQFVSGHKPNPPIISGVLAMYFPPLSRLENSM
jgi:hypothetical protein